MYGFDKVSTAAFYITFSCVLSGVTLGAFLSPFLRVEKEANVLLAYTFGFTFDAPSAFAGSHRKMTSEKFHCQELASIKQLPNSLRRRYMIGTTALFACGQLLFLCIAVASIVRLFIQESSMIRSIVRLGLFVAVVDIILWFSFTTVLMVKEMDYSVAGGYFDKHSDSDSQNIHYKVSYSIGFYLSLVAAIISIGSALGAPLAASR